MPRLFGELCKRNGAMTKKEANAVFSALSIARRGKVDEVIAYELDARIHRLLLECTMIQLVIDGFATIDIDPDSNGFVHSVTGDGARHVEQVERSKLS